jgi:hypothetical protein
MNVIQAYGAGIAVARQRRDVAGAEGFAVGTGWGDEIADRFFADFDIEILRSVYRGVRAALPKPHHGHRAGGAGSRSAVGVRNWRHRSNRGQMSVLSG